MTQTAFDFRATEVFRLLNGPGRFTYEQRLTRLVCRFWGYVEKSEGCWEWSGPRDAQGYGILSVGGRAGKVMPAHRVSYELGVGQIPAGLVVDHLCRTPSCVNPSHLEPVTDAENKRRGLEARRRGPYSDGRIVCANGHDWVPSSAVCRSCKSDRDRRYYEQTKHTRVKGPRTLDSDDPRHGTVGAYKNFGCRCVQCRAAESARYYAWKARKAG